MNKHFFRLIACAVFFFSTVTQVHTQDNLSPVKQQQQEMMETIMLRKTADNLRQNTALSEEEKGYMFQWHDFKTWSPLTDCTYL
jgi:Na+-translocating ferredoxin:NAD+ oxidoreductase RnfG subunit